MSRRPVKVAEFLLVEDARDVAAFAHYCLNNGKYGRAVRMLRVARELATLDAVREALDDAASWVEVWRKSMDLGALDAARATLGRLLDEGRAT